MKSKELGSKPNFQYVLRGVKSSCVQCMFPCTVSVSFTELLVKPHAPMFSLPPSGIVCLVRFIVICFVSFLTLYGSFITLVLFMLSALFT